MYLYCYVFCSSPSRLSPTRFFSFLLSFVAVLSICGTVLAQSMDDVHIVPRPEPHRSTLGMPPAERLKVDVEMVLVPVTVTDTQNHPVVDLEESNFKLFEGETEKKIQYFSSEDEPLSVGILVDLSSSMGNKIDSVREA